MYLFGLGMLGSCVAIFLSDGDYRKAILVAIGTLLVALGGKR